MKDWIDKNEKKNAYIKKQDVLNIFINSMPEEISSALLVYQSINQLPVVQPDETYAQPNVIRCNDCKYYRPMIDQDDLCAYREMQVFPDDYCSRAERREDG